MNDEEKFISLYIEISLKHDKAKNFPFKNCPMPEKKFGRQSQRKFFNILKPKWK